MFPAPLSNIPCLFPVDNNLNINLKASYFTTFPPDKMGATDFDPFAIFIQPPPNETPTERTARELREAEEKRVSDRIDEQIKLEKAAFKKQQSIVKVLLLGQSESGASNCIPFNPKPPTQAPFQENQPL